MIEWLIVLAIHNLKNYITMNILNGEGLLINWKLFLTEHQ